MLSIYIYMYKITLDKNQKMQYQMQSVEIKRD